MSSTTLESTSKKASGVKPGSSTIIGRQSEADQLKHVLTQDATTPVFIAGPAGSGKTHVTRQVIPDVAEQHEWQHHYVNLWHHRTRGAIFYELCDKLTRDGQLMHRQSTPVDDMARTLREQASRKTIAVLDEADCVADPDILYDLVELDVVQPVIITTDMERLTEQADPRLRSRIMSGRRISFTPYSTGDILNVLLNKIDEDELDVDPERLKHVANLCDGDMRQALKCMKQLSAGNNPGNVLQSLQDRKRIQRKEELNDHETVLLSIIEDHGEVKPAALYEQYREQVDDPRGERMLRKYLSKLEDGNLIRSEGKGRWRTLVATY